MSSNGGLSMHGMLKWIAVTAIVLASPVLAATGGPTAGTYMLEGGSYTISVEMDGDSLVVHEPNKDTPYTRQADGSFHAYNPNTNATYGIRVIDEHTIEAFKPNVPGNTPSRLVLINRATPEGEAVASAESDKWSELADSYMERSQSDPANIQSWTACGAVAMKRSVASQADADAYARQMASMLRQMDATSSPCPEVFTF